MSRDPLGARLVRTFVGELEEQVRALNADLLALEADPADGERLKAVFRVAHTLKGAARAASVPLVEGACHALEAMLAEARDGKRSLGAADFALLFRAADALTDAGQKLKSGGSLEGSALTELRAALTTPDARAATRPAPGPAPKEAAPATEAGDGQVRIGAEKLDALLAASGQLLVAQTRVASRPAELEALHDFATAWAGEWRRAGRYLRLTLERLGAGPRAAQMVSAVEEKLRQLVQDTGGIVTRVVADARELTRVTDAVADQVRRLRMRPFRDACEALPRTVRDLAAAAGKEARLELAGGDVEADRAVLDGLRDALLHLVRNAVDHGIERPEVRERAGKARGGMVTVRAELRGDRLMVTVTDDGAGLDVPAIRAQLERREIPVPADERDLSRALFEGGISTRTEATTVSGRGVGLDLVRAAVQRVRGSVTVTWEAGRGTICTLECPPTLATIRALLVAVGRQVLAVPTSHVERVLRARADGIRRLDGRDVVVTREAPVPLVALARLLPPLVAQPITGAVTIVVLDVGNRRLAVAVDELLTEQEIVLRPIGPSGQRLPHLSGATLLGTGRVALVLDPLALVSTGLGLTDGGGLTMAGAKPDQPAKRRILVVDDSITTRTLEQSILEAAGYDVVTAVDGADGWRVLQEQGADLIVADIEMPRMDGFALCEAIRAAKRFAGLPVVLVTALETPEHRARGLEVGADGYIGKSSFDQQNLLDTIQQLLG